MIQHDDTLFAPEGYLGLVHWTFPPLGGRQHHNKKRHLLSRYAYLQVIVAEVDGHQDHATLQRPSVCKHLVMVSLNSDALVGPVGKNPGAPSEGNQLLVEEKK